MSLQTLALALLLTTVATAPFASACCIHTTQTVAWSEYAVVDGSVVCVAPSSPAIVDTDGCVLLTSFTAYRIVVADASGRSVPLAWTAEGTDCVDVGGTGVGSVDVELPDGCDHVVLRLGADATSGVIRRA